MLNIKWNTGKEFPSDGWCSDADGVLGRYLADRTTDLYTPPGENGYAWNSHSYWRIDTMSGKPAYSMEELMPLCINIINFPVYTTASTSSTSVFNNSSTSFIGGGEPKEKIEVPSKVGFKSRIVIPVTINIPKVTSNTRLIVPLNTIIKRT